MDRNGIIDDINLMLMDADIITLRAVRNALEAILSADSNGRAERKADKADFRGKG